MVAAQKILKRTPLKANRYKGVLRVNYKVNQIKTIVITNSSKRKAEQPADFCRDFLLLYDDGFEGVFCVGI